MSISISEALPKLLQIVSELQSAYPRRRFTLDGRLVGDIGEVLVADRYDVALYRGLEKHYDGETSKNRKVQIKATLKNSVIFPADYVPELYLAIKVCPDGAFTELFNGPGEVIADDLKERRKPKNGLHTVTAYRLSELNKTVRGTDRVHKRRGSKR